MNNNETRMEQRTAERLSDSLDAKIIVGDSSYSGIIMNFSEKGLHLVTATLFDVVDIAAQTSLDLKCKLPTGEMVDINCAVKWFRPKPSPYGVSFSIGMEINDPPVQYKDFLKTCH